MHPSNRLNEVIVLSACYDNRGYPGELIERLPKDIRNDLKKLKSSDAQQVPKWMEKLRNKT